MSKFEPMTPEQVADHLARIKATAPKLTPTGKRKAKGPRKPRKSKAIARVAPDKPLGPRTIKLRAKHCINGVYYGPGETTVSHELASALEHADGKAVNYDDTWKDERAFVIGPRVEGAGHSLRRVHPSFFDAPDIAAAEAAVASKGDATQSTKDSGGNFNW